MSFLSAIQTRLLKLNKNFLACCVGPPGSGKSFAMMRIAEILDPEFNIDRVVFSSEQFRQLLNSGTLKPGSFIVWDEAGVGVGSREALTRDNRLTTKIAQTFRHRNYALLFTVPSLKFVDVQIRELIHVIFTPKTIDRWNKKVLLDVNRVTHNEKINKTYIKPLYLRKEGERIMIDGLWLKRPSKELRGLYETKKDLFTGALNEREVNPSNLKVERSKPDIKGIIKKALKKKEQYIKMYNGRFVASKELISLDYDLGDKLARQVKVGIEREVNNG